MKIIHLIDIVETHNIEKGNDCAFVKAGEDMINIDLQVPVSMNMWLYSQIFLQF